jgi:hypothetical protein
MPISRALQKLVERTIAIPTTSFSPVVEDIGSLVGFTLAKRPKNFYEGFDTLTIFFRILHNAVDMFMN